MKCVLKLGFAEILALVFIVLKLCGVVSWSWWWVLSPIWIPIVLVLLLLLLGIAWAASGNFIDRPFK